MQVQKTLLMQGILKKKMNLLKTTLYCQYGLLIPTVPKVKSRNYAGRCTYKHPDLKTMGSSMIGSLMYLTASRPDIMFAVCACSRFQSPPHFDLKPTHIDYAGAKLDRKSTQEVGQFYGRKIISWQCREADHCGYFSTIRDRKNVDVASCGGKILWIQHQMVDYVQFHDTNRTLENESTIGIEKESNNIIPKIKHIAISTTHKGSLLNKQSSSVPSFHVKKPFNHKLIAFHGSSLVSRDTLGKL
ncbi:hypothetical protein Tco_0186413 [Tanacetum coccineum]